MVNTEKTLYEMRIVPDEHKNFGLFDGIVIAKSVLGNDFIISKMVKKDNGYYTDSWISVPYSDVHEHISHLKKPDLSGKVIADFLIGKAKDFSKCNENIAIAKSLAENWEYKDNEWLEAQKHM